MRRICRARELRRNLTDAERALWQVLRNRQVSGYRFRRQAPIGPYVVDFVCFEIRLVIEVDGGQHIERADYDEGRTAWLEGAGFRVIRFWNNEVLLERECGEGCDISCGSGDFTPILAFPRRGGREVFGLCLVGVSSPSWSFAVEGEGGFVQGWWL